MGTLTPGAEAWQSIGSIQEVNSYKIHCYYRDLPSKPDAPLLLFLHGYPTCSYDWSKVIESLQLSFPVLAFDFLGFGLSEKPREHNYTLSGHADLALELVQRFSRKSRRIFLVGHDMGTSVVAEILARELEGTLPPGVGIGGALIFNGNMIMEKASLVLGQKLLRTPFGFIFSALSTKRIFLWQFDRAVSKQPPDDSTYEDQWSLVSYNGGNRLLHKTIQYTFERVSQAERLLGAIRDSRVPLTFAWGMDDPVATARLQLEGWKALRPSAPVHELHGCGHYPQLEDPQAFVRVLYNIFQESEK